MLIVLPVLITSYLFFQKRWLTSIIAIVHLLGSSLSIKVKTSGPFTLLLLIITGLATIWLLFRAGKLLSHTVGTVRLTTCRHSQCPK